MNRGVVITPYYKESRETLEQCIESVDAQTIPVQHIMVADGFPQDWVDQRANHLRLYMASYDWGNGPRAAALSVYRTADFAAFLDADNQYDSDHIAVCLATAEQNPGCDYVATQERFARAVPGGFVTSHAKAEPQEQHVDSSCFFLLPQCYDVAIKAFSTAPDPYRGDRNLYACLKAAGLRVAFTNRITMTYNISSLHPDKKHPR